MLYKIKAHGKLIWIKFQMNPALEEWSFFICVCVGWSLTHCNFNSSCCYNIVHQIRVHLIFEYWAIIGRYTMAIVFIWIFLFIIAIFLILCTQNCIYIIELHSTWPSCILVINNTRFFNLFDTTCGKPRRTALVVCKNLPGLTRITK